VRKVEFAYWGKQQQYAESQALIRGFVGGRGSGKTQAGAQDLLDRCKPGRMYAIIAPTYKVLDLATWRTLVLLAKEKGLLVKENRSDSWITVLCNGGGTCKIVGRTAEDPALLEGMNLSGAVLDEARKMHPAVMKSLYPCLREGGEMGWLGITTTPLGRRHWVFELFYDRADKPEPNTFLVQASTRENPFLPEEFYDEQRRVMTTALAEQELEGLFVELAGLMFDRAWFPLVEPNEVPLKVTRARYWDKAGTEGAGAFSAGVKMAADYEDGVFYVENCVRGQWSASNREKMIMAIAIDDRRKHKRGNQPSIYIEQEPGSGGKESAQNTVKMLAGWPVYLDVVSGAKHRVIAGEKMPGEAKIIRAMPFAASAEHGNVRIVRGNWNDDWLDELSLFPEYRLMDQVDASSGAFNKLCSRRTISATPSSMEASGASVIPTGIQVIRAHRSDRFKHRK